MALGILRTFFNVKNEDIQILIRLGNSSGSRASLAHWHQCTGLPAKDIFVNIDSRQNKTKARHGICRITLKKGGTMLKLMHCIISAMASKAESSLCPRSSMDRAPQS